MKLFGLRNVILAGIVIGLVAGSVGIVWAQRTPDKPIASPYAEVLQRIGTTDVKITYHRPGVKGREGQLWGTNIVPYGGDPMPWRAGANQNTVFTFSDDVRIEGKDLEAGTYGFHIIPTENEWTLIWSTDAAGWGSFRYKPENDALRVTVTPQEAPHKEWLEYGFENLQPPQASTSAACTLHWEKKKIAFTIEETKTYSE